MKYAIFGGSFDPVHNGHLSMALAVLTLGYDRIILVPAYRSPFKSLQQSESADIRLMLLLSAISGDRRFTVDACEIKREGVSYTIDTLCDIRERYPMSGKPALILGDDIASSFLQWKDAERITENADIIIASRFSSAQISYPYPCSFLGNAIMKVSSGSVRDLIQENGHWQPLVPEGVCKVIEKHGLYGARKALTCEDEEFDFRNESSNMPVLIKYIENTARNMMNPYRFIHSRNVALHASDLAVRFACNSDNAYLAGIIHDICKEFRPSDLMKYAMEDGAAISRLENKKPSLLHGRAAAMLIQEKFGINDADIIEAVRFHTTGKLSMGPLAKIVYIADKIEAARTTVDSRLRRLVFGDEGKNTSLDDLFGIVFETTVKWLMDRGFVISDETLKLFSGMKYEKTDRF
ncbi:MAG: nicotinate (nicotinamide) nucleotide adenylyltransferase [Treponema sp.]|nr:nicotinate (nicotinamide) nucleotide adenylyltransferase [Treponema sp.]